MSSPGLGRSPLRLRAYPSSHPHLRIRVPWKAEIYAGFRRNYKARFEELCPGRILCQSDGSGDPEFQFQAVSLHPYAFLERLCTLVPRPRQHQLTYAGVLAPASPRRRAIIPASTPRRRRPTIPPNCAKSRTEQTREGEQAPRKKPKNRARTNPYIRWSEFLRRSFGIDVFTCPHCNGRRRILAFLEDPVVVHKILDHLGLP